MKKYLRVLFVLGTIGLLLFWKPVQGAQGETIIIVQKQGPLEEPRMPSFNPFFAERFANNVLLGASPSCGIVNVWITSTSGDYFFTYYDTTDGSIYLPISGDPGFYSLSITTSAGAYYVGEFTI